MCWVDSRTLHQGKGKPKHMAEANTSDNSLLFLFFFITLSPFFKDRGMKADMVETSKVWHPSSPRKLSCWVHLRYTLLPVSIIWWRIQNEPPAVVTAAVVFCCDITTAVQEPLVAEIGRAHV